MTVAKAVKIRPMEQQDIDAVFEIDKRIAAVERSFTYADMIDTFIGGQVGWSLVAEDSGRVIGFALAAITYVPEQVSEACTIQVVGVDPEYRRRGIAKKLVEKLADNCCANGLKLIRIMVDQRDSQLQGLFESLEFRRGRLIDYSKNL